VSFSFRDARQESKREGERTTGRVQRRLEIVRERSGPACWSIEV
jgi:hypothetical protein